MSFADISKVEINNHDAVHKHYTSINRDDLCYAKYNEITKIFSFCTIEQTETLMASSPKD